MANNVVWKYELEAEDEQELLMPPGAELLSAGTNAGKVFLWAHVDGLEGPDHFIKRKVIIHGTGHPAEDVQAYDFVGTVMLHDGVLCFHVFDGGEVDNA